MAPGHGVKLRIGTADVSSLGQYNVLPGFTCTAWYI